MMTVLGDLIDAGYLATMVTLLGLAVVMPIANITGMRRR